MQTHQNIDARLQYEVERLTLLANGKWQAIERAEDAVIWNDAIEAAAKICHRDQGRFDTPDRIRALRRPT